MSRLTIYQYPKCSTCRKAVKLLESQGHELESVNVFEEPPTAAQLEQLIQLSGLDIRKFFNTSGEVYREMNLKEKLPHMTDAEKIDLLASNGRLIKRPIVTDGRQVTVGFKEAEFVQSWS